MGADVLIVGQGLAGTLLGWELERAGVAFTIVDPGHANAASAVAAGLISPVTGQRLVKSWGIDEFLPLAREAYASLGSELGIRLWRDLRIRRTFGAERERATAREKSRQGELAPYVTPELVDEEGLWIEGAARVEVGALLAGARARWRAQGQLREALFDRLEVGSAGLVIDCTGAAGTGAGRFDFVPWEYSNGEVLEIVVAGLPLDLVRHRRHAVVPLPEGRAWVGATHDPGLATPTTTKAGAELLAESARHLLRSEFTIAAHRAGVRVNLPEKRPAVGRHPDNPNLGCIHGLGAKGALWAPMLARQWRQHLLEGRPFDPEVAVGRFY